MANPVVIPQAAWELMLTELVAASNLWNGAKVLLFKNNVSPGPNTVLGDLTECDFTGYAVSAAVTWGTPGWQPDGTAIVVGDLKTFTVGATPTILNTVYGWALVDTGKTVCYLARKFDTAVNLTQAGNFVDVVPSYPAYQLP